ncbi:MAG: nuclear transport factor 2 family protein [Sphingobacteriales bacterium]|nr:MAG: nuclear transport factor 2 family protein [Sphingobacteriales bacterium]
MKINHTFTGVLYYAFTFALLASNLAWSEPTTPKDITQSLALFGKAWNEPNAAKREILINAAWVEDGEFMDPTTQVKGRKNLLPIISDFITRYPDAEVIQTSTIDQHHSVYRVSWKIILKNGEQLTEGTDFGEFNKEGKITRITSFFGPVTAYKINH